jgi:UDP-3-O-[3-hydroxymyristoyl] glucosamine N-acyltransferase
LTLAELATRLECRLEGDGALEVARVASLDAAGPGDLTFFANPRYHAALLRTRATAVILADDAPAAPCAMLRSRRPYESFARAIEQLSPQRRPIPGVHPTAVVAADVSLGADVHIGPLVTIDEGARVGARSVVLANAHVGARATIGADCTIHSHATVREDVVIGDRVILQNGAVIGADGYGFAQREDGSHLKILQIGTVVIEDDVEIGANTTLDRPAVGETRIGAGTKIDNLVQVAHGVRVGRDVLLAAQTGIAGSTTVEDNVMLGGQVGVAGHITIGRGARATAQTGIPNSVEPGALVSGYPAIDNRDWLKASAVFRHLPELKRRITELEDRLASLAEQLSASQRRNG